MTRPLRRAHFRIWVLLSLAVLALLIEGLAARRSTTPANPSFRWERVK
jgi:hypothetical protein